MSQKSKWLERLLGNYLGLIPTGKFCVLQVPLELKWGWQVSSDYLGAGWSTTIYFREHGSIPSNLGSGFVYDSLIEGSNVREVIQYNLEHPAIVPALPASAFHPATPTALPLPNTVIPDSSPPTWLFPATPTQNPVLIQPIFSPTAPPTSTLPPTITPTATVPQSTIQSIDSFPEAWQFPGTPTATPSSTPSSQP